MTLLKLTLNQALLFGDRRLASTLCTAFERLRLGGSLRPLAVPLEAPEPFPGRGDSLFRLPLRRPRCTVRALPPRSDCASNRK